MDQCYTECWWMEGQDQCDDNPYNEIFRVEN
jgi:hypothetical protein